VAVVDASIVADWVAPRGDPSSAAVRVLRDLADAGEEVAAPRLLLEEVANALLTGIRRGRWSGHEADTAFTRLVSLPARLVDDERDLARAWDLSRRYDNHPVYDMLYVAVAERLRTVLVTADDSLRTRLTSLSFVIGPSGPLG
jgi:predicted nucleic acid-binding protein